MVTITLSIPGGRIGHFLAGAAVASVIGGTAIAVTGPNFTYSSVQTGFLSISPSAMSPANYWTAENYRIYPEAWLESSEEPEGCFVTGINLPQGSKILSVTTFFRSSSQSDLKVQLIRKNMQTRGTVRMVEQQYFENTAASVSRTTNVSSGVATINNSTFAYGFSVCLSGGTTFDSARINYTYTSAGD